MRTNVAGFALAFGMGSMVVLLGLLALSAAGLTELAPGLAAEVEASAPADTVRFAGGTPAYAAPIVAYVPADPAGAAALAEGDALFKNNCAQCHAVNERVVGPALAGLARRRPIGWVVKWVQNPAKVIASGDEYAVKLFNDYGQQMPAFPQLTERQIRRIVAWTQSQAGTDATVSADALVAAR